jgi:hypothetical protein
MRRCIVLLLSALPFCLVAADDKGKLVVVPVAEAPKHENEKCIVEMEVKSTGGREQIVFLNSETNYRTESNFTVVIRGKMAIEKFKAAKIDDPKEYYKDKKIRVTGTIMQREKKFQIVVDDPKQIETVDKK